MLLRIWCRIKVIPQIICKMMAVCQSKHTAQLRTSEGRKHLGSAQRPAHSRGW